MASEYAESLRKTPVVTTPPKAVVPKAAPKAAAPVVETPKTAPVAAPAPAPAAARSTPVIPRAAAPTVETPRTAPAPADANSANARESRTQNFISGGTGPATVKSVATELIKSAPNVAKDALKREAALSNEMQARRAGGHIVNFVSDIAQGVANVGINAVNAESAALNRALTKRGIGDGDSAYVIPNVRTPKLNVSSTTGDFSVAGGSLDRDTKVGTAKSLGFVVKGAPEETVSRVVQGASLVPLLKPIKLVKGASNAVTNEIGTAVKASTGSVKPTSVKPTFEPSTPGGPTTPKIIRTKDPVTTGQGPEIAMRNAGQGAAVKSENATIRKTQKDFYLDPGMRAKTQDFEYMNKFAAKTGKLFDSIEKGPEQLAKEITDSMIPRFNRGTKPSTKSGKESSGGKSDGTGETGTGSGGTRSSGSGNGGPGTSGRGPGGPGGRTATLERTDTKVTDRGPGGRGGVPEPERISPPKVETPKPNPYWGRGGGSSTKTDTEQVIKVGANVTPKVKTAPKTAPKTATAPKTTSGVSTGSGTTIVPRTGTAAGVKIATPLAPSITNYRSRSGGGGGRDTDLALNFNSGMQFAQIAKVF